MGRSLVEGKWILMSKIATNIQKIARSGKPPEQDDLFAIRLSNGKHLFGQVILVDPPRAQAPMPVSKLVYIFADQYESMSLENVNLSADHLLLPPVWTNALGWTKGYFQKIDIGSSKIRLKQHCFRRHDGVYLDERGRRLLQRSEPCGEWGLASYRWIDDRISDALGIPRAPEEIGT